MEVWPRLKVFRYGQILIRRRLAGLEYVEEEYSLDEEVEGEAGLGEKLFVDLPVVIVQAMELEKMMSLIRKADVVRLFEVVGLGQGC